MGNAHRDELKKLADLLAKCVEDLFKERAGVNFSKPPEIACKTIVEYYGKMRANGMEKFNNPTFVATVNYYANPEALKKNQVLGALIVYVEQSYIVQLLKLLKYPLANDEDENEMKDCCGTLGNIIAGSFKSAIAAQGFAELDMSPFSTYKNNAVTGVLFYPKEWDKYELTFFMDNTKRLVLEMTMGPLPKR